MTPVPNAIEIRDLHKSYRMPTHRVETFKERALHPFRSVEYTELRALNDISFDIGAGEFFGIAGRNGSGKTTLLKLLASIYAPDRGTIRVAGRIAPFIELGVGFNPDLAARDNILLNGVMMGLTPKQAEARFDRVIEFAELEEFVEMKLKNYSSGMRVRLGFAMLVEADAEILLIDEVLAVGDASFQQKCADTFYDFQRQGRTIVLVTHAMPKLEEYCDRAVLLHDARMDCIGDPNDVGQRYLELNFPRAPQAAASPSGRAQDGSDGAQSEWPARIVDFRFEDESGIPRENFKHGEPICFSGLIEPLQSLQSCCFGIAVHDAAGVSILAIRSQDITARDGDLEPGGRTHVRGRVENPLASGHYFAHIGLTIRRDASEPLYMESNAGDFVVFGAEDLTGVATVIAPKHEFRIQPDPGEVRHRAEQVAAS
ncbi:MAG TPA: ABC transporter ATP-binding protein [Solirubrobacterales bacterium]|nr:ABC transporter ATP-binding protein [Solirubrobacterales bacterium]